MVIFRHLMESITVGVICSNMYTYLVGSSRASLILFPRCATRTSPRSGRVRNDGLDVFKARRYGLIVVRCVGIIQIQLRTGRQLSYLFAFVFSDVDDSSRFLSLIMIHSPLSRQWAASHTGSTYLLINATAKYAFDYAFSFREDTH